MPVRYANAGERSIIFKGHEQSAEASALHAGQQRIERVRDHARSGVRDVALQEINDVCQSHAPLFTTLQAALTLPQMGYRYPMFAHMFPAIDIDYAGLRAPELAALLELALTSCNTGWLREIARRARSSPIHPGTRRFLAANYLRMANEGPRARVVG